MRSRRGAVLARIETEAATECERHLRALLEASRVPGTRDWFELSRAQIEEAVAAARTWLTDELAKSREVRRLGASPSDGRLLEPDSRAYDLYQELRRLKAEEYGARTRRLRVENELRLLVGTADGIGSIASWKTLVQRRFQQARFRVEHAHLFEEFVAPASYRPFRLL